MAEEPTGKTTSRFRITESGFNLKDETINLAETATEFLKYAPSYATNIKAKTLNYKLWYALIGLVLIIPLWVVGVTHEQQVSIFLITFSAEFLVSGAILLYLGFKSFSLEQFVPSIPVVKIDAATYGLNKMQGRFIPYNAAALKAPISGAECVYYSVGLYIEAQEQNYMRCLRGIGKGAPTLFTDDSGYLAVDLVKAPNLQVILNAFGLNVLEINEAATEIMSHIEEAANNNSTVDLSQISGYKFNLIVKNKIRDLKEDITEYDVDYISTFKFRLFLIEQYIPANSDYTCLGGVADTDKSIDGKPVKLLVPDEGSGIMAVYAGTTQNARKRIGKQTLLNMVVGVLFVIVALGILS
ncbi:MAG: hypothetical protein RXR32_02110, partial [Candidatus Micrarchaeota archaeon]